jgi:hypothetical protein
VSDEAVPHETSLAVWDIPSPLPLGGTARIKVGVRCAVGCPLVGQQIEVLDSTQNKAASTRTGPSPLPGTIGLYWAEATIIAPLTEGPHLWTARFLPSGLETSHAASSLTFGLITVRPPELRITVKVIQQNTNTPIDTAEVRLDAFRALTNEGGVATLDVPKGRYEFNVWKMGYEFVTRNLEINSDQTLKIELPVEPEPSPFGEG